MQSTDENRIFVERLLVRDAATSARKSDVERLTIALSNNKNAIKNSTVFYATDMAFHGVLYRIPNNPIFPALHNSYTAWLEPNWIKLRSTGRNLVNFHSHEAIYNAILGRDPDNAEAALSRHLNAAWEYVRVTFDDED
jgi:DNA-binding FadR family transcriptional regulator